MPCAFHAERPFPFHELGSGCQFEVADSELISIDGELWCEFHAPIEDRNRNNTVKGD